MELTKKTNNSKQNQEIYKNLRIRENSFADNNKLRKISFSPNNL